MSYDIHFDIDVGALEPCAIGLDYNYTYNVGDMFRRALGREGLYRLDGKLCGDLIDPLRAAIDHMSAPANESAYAALNPPNGWGSHTGALDLLRSILASCESHPKATVRVT